VSYAPTPATGCTGSRNNVQPSACKIMKTFVIFEKISENFLDATYEKNKWKIFTFGAKEKIPKKYYKQHEFYYVMAQIMAKNKKEIDEKYHKGEYIKMFIGRKKEK